MSTSPYDLYPWAGVTGSASGGVSAPSGSGNVNRDTAAVRALAQVAAAQAAARAAHAAAVQGATNDVIVMMAKVAALPAWRNVVGTADGYEGYEPGIFDQAASLLNPVTSNATPIVDTAARVAGNALRDATAGGIGALFGGAGTAVILGAGALILFVLLRK